MHPAAPAARRAAAARCPGEVRPLEEIEAEVIRFAIAHYRGQMSEVARRLRIGRSTLYRKLDELGLGGAKSGEPRRKRGERVTPAAKCAQAMNLPRSQWLISLATLESGHPSGGG